MRRERTRTDEARAERSELVLAERALADGGLHHRPKRMRLVAQSAVPVERAEAFAEVPDGLRERPIALGRLCLRHAPAVLAMHTGNKIGRGRRPGLGGSDRRSALGWIGREASLPVVHDELLQLLCDNAAVLRCVWYVGVAFTLGRRVQKSALCELAINVSGARVKAEAHQQL